MNQLGSTDLYLSRPAVLFDCASRIARQKFDFDSDVELLHVPNQMHTLRINYINYIYPRGLRVPSTWHAQRTSLWTRWRKKRNVFVLLVSKQLNILVCDVKDLKKKRIYSWCAHAPQTDRNFPIQAISKAKPQDFSEQNLQKQHLKKTLLYSNRHYATEVTSITL